MPARVRVGRGVWCSVSLTHVALECLCGPSGLGACRQLHPKPRKVCVVAGGRPVAMAWEARCLHHETMKPGPRLASGRPRCFRFWSFSQMGLRVGTEEVAGGGQPRGTSWLVVPTPTRQGLQCRGVPAVPDGVASGSKVSLCVLSWTCQFQKKKRIVLFVNETHFTSLAFRRKA